MSPPSGPPPLRKTGLLLHAEGFFTHEGHPIRHARLRAVLERSVRYLPDEAAFVVQLGRFRGQIEVEDAPFFVRAFRAEDGCVALSDESVEPLDPDTLEEDSAGILYCRVKRDIRADVGGADVGGGDRGDDAGLVARFTHAAQAHLLDALEIDDDGAWIQVGGRRHAVAPRARAHAASERAPAGPSEESEA